MPLSPKLPALSLALLLAACATDKDFNKGVAEANFKLGIGYMPVSYTHLDVYKRQAALKPNSSMKFIVSGPFTRNWSPT